MGEDPTCRGGGVGLQHAMRRHGVADGEQRARACIEWHGILADVPSVITDGADNSKSR